MRTDNDIDGYENVLASIGKTIMNISFVNLGSDREDNEEYKDELCIEFSDKSLLWLYDSWHMCCETRYMRTDDNFADFIGAKFLGVEIKEASRNTVDDWSDHDIQFMEIKTSLGSLTMASHNEHNGYYGGFCITAQLSLGPKFQIGDKVRAKVVRIYGEWEWEGVVEKFNWTWDGAEYEVSGAPYLFSGNTNRRVLAAEKELTNTQP